MSNLYQVLLQFVVTFTVNSTMSLSFSEQVHFSLISGGDI